MKVNIGNEKTLSRVYNITLPLIPVSSPRSTTKMKIIITYNSPLRKSFENAWHYPVDEQEMDRMNA